MADTKISALTDGTTAAATDRIPVVRDPTGTPVNRWISPGYIRTYMIGTANTWTGQNTWSLNGAASTPPASLTGTWFTGGSATTTKPQFLIEPTGTTSTGWSTSGTGLGVNAPSGFAGNLIDAQVAATRKFNVDKDGTVEVSTTGSVGDNIGARVKMSFSATPFVTVASGGYFGLANANVNLADVILTRDAANTLAQRNGTSAQAFKIYNTYTDASNYERGIFDWSTTANTLTIGIQKAGTGTNRNLEFNMSGGLRLRYDTSLNRWISYSEFYVQGADIRIVSSGYTLGYGTGSGGAVTQASSRTTGVTLNTGAGAITLFSAAGSTTPATFTVTNSTVAATDTVILSQKSGTDLYDLKVTAVAAGSFNITFNTTGGTTTEQPVFNFAVIKAVAS